MLKKISVSVLALAAMGFAAPAFAVPVNPWAPAQTTVPITVTVAPMVEMNANQTAVVLTVNDAGTNGGSASAVDSYVNHLSNIPVDISASIDNDIPTNTEFWILIESDGSWTEPNNLGQTNAEGVLNWMRSGGLGAYTVGALNVPQFAFDRPSTAGTALADNKVDIEYFATGWNAMPAVQTNSFNVVWTIAPSP